MTRTCQLSLSLSLSLALSLVFVYGPVTVRSLSFVPPYVVGDDREEFPVIRTTQSRGGNTGGISGIQVYVGVTPNLEIVYLNSLCL